MRINQYLAAGTELSRRAADQAIRDGQVLVDGRPALIGESLSPGAEVVYLSQVVKPAQTLVIAFHKPVGVVCSRRKQGGSRTVYDLLPQELQLLNSVGRLDKDSSGLLILTNDGALNQRLSHPSHGKVKVYEVELDQALTPDNRRRLSQGVKLDDGPSRLEVLSQAGRQLVVALEEGRNRQIRRTLRELGYTVTKLHRTSIGGLELGDLAIGRWRQIPVEQLT